MKPTNPWRPLVLVALGLFVLIQLVPYGRNHSNPPVQAEPRWDSPNTRMLFHRACQDCHSHQTHWPWYAHVAPMSWLLQRDVEAGRSKFNVNIEGFGREAGEAAETVAEGKMPMQNYLLLHPEARLTELEKQQLVQGLRATFGEDRRNQEEDPRGHSSGKGED